MGKMHDKVLRTLFAAIFVCGMVPTAALADDSVSGGETGDAATAGGSGQHPVYVEGEVVVAYDASYSEGKIMSMMDEGDLGIVSSLSKSQEVIADDDQVIALVELADGVSVEQAVEEMGKDARVDYVQPNFLYHMMEGEDLLDMPADASATYDVDATGETEAASAAETGEAQAVEAAQTTIAPEGASAPMTTVVNDPYANIATDDTARENQWWLYSVNAFEAWDSSKSNHNVTVAVLDTGINFQHEDLKNNIDTEHAWDAEAGTKLTKSATSATGHGTHVAGIIAAEANNGIGFAGASCNAKVLPVNVFYYDSYYGDYYAKTTTLTKGYQYLKGLVNSGELTDLHVINMSLGGYGSLDSTDIAFKNEIASMNSLGVLTVCAGGNGDDYGNPITSPSYPGDYDECVSVVALKSDDERAKWADYNQYKDISAPGVNIWSTWVEGTNATKRASGTSMASPLVAGCAALLFAAQPDITVDDAKEALYSSAVDLGEPGWDQYYGWGKVDAQAMLATLRGAKISSDVEGVYVTQSANFSAELYTNLDDDPATGTGWTWSVDKPDVARINDTGTLTALKEGTVKITATSTIDPAVKGSKNITVKPIAVPDGIEADSSQNAVKVTWSEAPAATGYDVYRAAGSSEEGNWGKVATIVSDQGVQDGDGAVSFEYSDSDVEVGVPYYYKVVPFGTIDGQAVPGKETASVVTMFKTTLMEYAGDSRYGTMKKTVNMYSAERAITDDEIDTVIVASGETFPDALASSGFAGTQNAPVVLTSSTELNDDAAASIQSINPSKVIVLGGEGAIAPEVVDQIKELVPTTAVRRVYGSTRYETAVKIYDEGKGSWGSTAFIASGNNDKFADSLSASPYAYAAKSPVFLVDSTSAQGLSATTLQRLRSGGFDRVVILGGTASVPQTVVRQLTRLGISYERWSGDTRYETSEIIASKGIAEGVLSPNEIGVATGSKPWDALSSGPLLGMQGNPLVLMDSGSGLVACDKGHLLPSKSGSIDRLSFFGGTASVSRDVRDQAARAAGLE